MSFSKQIRCSNRHKCVNIYKHGDKSISTLLIHLRLILQISCYVVYLCSENLKGDKKQNPK